MFTTYTIVASLILFFFVLQWDVESDYKKIKEKIPINHFKEGVIRILLLIPSIFLFALPKIYYSDKINLDVCTLYLGLSTGVLFSAWWEFFDGWLNKKRGYKWRFNGSIDPDDPVLDKFLHKIGDFWEGVLKITLIVSFLTAYILL
jgi:hypothetical protein